MIPLPEFLGLPVLKGVVPAAGDPLSRAERPNYKAFIGCGEGKIEEKQRLSERRER
jgi:hypothetical protein